MTTEITEFVPRAEAERQRMIQEARAIYESIFPSEPPPLPKTRSNVPPAVANERFFRARHGGSAAILRAHAYNATRR